MNKTYFFPDPKKYSQPKLKTGLKQKAKEPTGELKFFKEIFIERNGLCEITGAKIEFHPISFMHMLSKGAYPKFRLKKENVMMVIPNIHHVYDNGNREYLLHLYPKAKIIYDKKEALKIEYYQQKPTI